MLKHNIFFKILRNAETMFEINYKGIQEVNFEFHEK